ncbi:MAG: LLM class flavin-dependent oxidoreductase [Actinomycetota bacterium]
MEFWTGGMGLFKVRAAPAALADSYDGYVQGAKQAEALGFDAYLAPEHHFMYDGFIPSPLVALAAAASATTKIRLVTGALLLPLYDPLAAAELASTVDVLSGGRVILGLGMGYRPYEFDGIGTEKRTRGERLVEGLQVIMAATRGEEFSFEGRHYRYEKARLSPVPIQRPIPVWFCGGTSPRAARRAGQAGARYWLANANLELLETTVREYRRAGTEAGFPEEELQVACFKDVCLGDTVEEAEYLREMLLHDFYDEHILGYGYLVDDTGKHLYGLDRDRPAYRRFVDSIFCGTADMVIEELRRYEALGLDALLIQTAQLDRFATDVMPAFR